MEYRFRAMHHDEFLAHINFLYNKLNDFLIDKNLKIDYVVPLLRSGAVPAVYLANKLNIVKFAPFQVKHIKYNNNKETIEILFNPLNELEIKKSEPCFLVIEGTHSTGKSAELCIDNILSKYPIAKILYVCIAKEYNSKNFDNKVIFESSAYQIGENLSLEQCKILNIDPNCPIYPWESLEDQLTHPDDLENNIFF